MYIEKIKIDKFRVLENIEIHFQPPGGATADPETGSVVNVIAGVNGCGKSTLLDLIDKIRDDAYRKRNNETSRFSENINYVPDSENGFCMNAEEGKIYLKDAEPNKIKDQLDGSEAIFFGDVVYFNFGSFSRSKENERHDPKKSEMYKEISQTINNYVINLERESSKLSSEERKKDSMKKFNKIFEGVDFYTRFSGVKYESGVFNPEFMNVNGQKVFIRDLSDGEQRIYLSAVEMMRRNYDNKIILMDEPEISLHPAWQQKIMQIYSRIGKNNQFIVATHSPQIIANTPYQNLIILEKKDDKIVRRHLNRPPIGADVNSILGDFMGVAGEFPEKVVDLHRQYREKVEQGLENSIDAEKIRLELLNHESNDSRFMQEMRMLQRLRGRK